MHITHNCNLTCESCSDFTNVGHSKMLSIDECKMWMSNWNERIEPEEFIIIGGEPTLHKNLIDIIFLSKKMWKNSKIKLTTNGFFLHNHPELPKVLKECDAILSISIHDNSEDYLKKIENNLRMCKEWKEKYDLKIKLDKSFEDWKIIYKGYGQNITPFEDNNPQLSWDNCFMDGMCFQLYEGKIWKCPPLAYLSLQKEKYGNLLSPKWDPYLKYKPLEPNCSDDAIVEFFNRKSESVCGMCPTKKIIRNKIIKNPLMSVQESKEYFENFEELF